MRGKHSYIVLGQSVNTVQMSGYTCGGGVERVTDNVKVTAGAD